MFTCILTMIILFGIVFIAILDDNRPYATKELLMRSRVYIISMIVLGVIAASSALTI